MGDELFKVVFKGEVGFDFDQAEVKDNLRKFCGFSQDTVDRLFSGGSYVLKKDIDQPTATRYVDALQKLGALAERMPMAPQLPTARLPASYPEPGARQIPAGHFKCPACGHSQTKGLTCIACGIAFAKFQAALQRKALAGLDTSSGRPEIGSDEPFPPVPVAPSSLAGTRDYLVNCSILILGLTGFHLLLGNHLRFLGFILLPAAFLFYILYQVTARDQNLAAGMAEHVAVQIDRSGPTVQQRGWFPRVTYGLVLLHLMLYYGLSIHLKPATLLNHFSFLPATPNFWNVPLSALTAQVLHADGWQLWGSVVFLWIVGTTVEKSLGSIRFLVIYLLTGMAAGEFGALAHSLFLGSPLHGLGSSGAIAGLIGIFAVCCRSRSMVFPLPVLGAISLVYPLSVIIRLDARAVIGMFFFCSLSGGLEPHPGWTGALVEHLVNIGGMAAGVLIGLLLNPEKLTAGESALTG